MEQKNNTPQKTKVIDFSKRTTNENIEVQGKRVRIVEFENKLLFNLNDVKKVVNITTESSLVANKLNEIGIPAFKVLTQGGATPSWYTTKKGIISYIERSKKFKQNHRLKRYLVNSIANAEKKNVHFLGENKEEIKGEKELKKELIKQISALNNTLQRLLIQLEKG